MSRFPVRSPTEPRPSPSIDSRWPGPPLYRAPAAGSRSTRPRLVLATNRAEASCGSRRSMSPAPVPSSTCAVPPVRVTSTHLRTTGSTSRRPRAPCSRRCWIWRLIDRGGGSHGSFPLRGHGCPRSSAVALLIAWTSGGLFLLVSAANGADDPAVPEGDVAAHKNAAAAGQSDRCVGPADRHPGASQERSTK